MTDSAERLAEAQSDLGGFIEEAPDVEQFLSFVESTESVGALDPKTKELISLSIGVAVRCEPCILWHADGAIDAGATAEEITEALTVAVVMGGGPALMYASKAYRVQAELREAE